MPFAFETVGLWPSDMGLVDTSVLAGTERSLHFHWLHFLLICLLTRAYHHVKLLAVLPFASSPQYNYRHITGSTTLFNARTPNARRTFSLPPRLPPSPPRRHQRHIYWFLLIILFTLWLLAPIITQFSLFSRHYLSAAYRYSFDFLFGFSLRQEPGRFRGWKWCH
jgi:hypothetical protein